MEHQGYSVPHALREHYVMNDGFPILLRQRGWTLFEHRPIYTDRSVICQKWLLAPSGRTYTDRELYHRFGEWCFRAFLRVFLATSEATREMFVDACPDAKTFLSTLVFLHDQEMLLQTRHGYTQGPTLNSIRDIGHTLEWWCAEWLRRTQAWRGQVPVRHGVVLTELMKEGDLGDLDVVAFLRGNLLLIECKSSLLQLDPGTLNLFFWRAAKLEADLALLLIDVPISQIKPYLARVQRRLARWRIVLMEGDGARGVYWNEGLPIAAVGPSGQSVSCKSGRIYVAFSTQENSLERVLSTIVYHHRMRTS